MDTKKEDLDSVFAARKKVGFYERIESKTLEILEEAFEKVLY